MAQLQDSKRSAASDVAPEDIIALLRRSTTETVAQLLADLDPTMRAEMALFCYRRAHLHDFGFAIAATCDRETLVAVAGAVGEVMFDMSRCRTEPRSRVSTYGRRPITLSHDTIRIFAQPEDDDVDCVDNVELVPAT